MASSESRRRSGGKHVRVPMGSRYKPGVQVSIGTTRAFLEISFSLQTRYLSTCVCQQFLCFPSQISCIREDLTEHLLNFSFALFFHDDTNKERIAPTITAYTYAQQPLNPVQTEWKCLSRRWAIVKVSPPLEQTTYNTARQHNTHCFQQELPAPLLTQPCLGFHLLLSKMVRPARGEFSYALLNI